MAVTDRQVGRNLAVFSVGGVEYLASIRECSIERRTEPQENRALKDAVRYNQPVIKDWRISWRMAVNAVDHVMATLLNAVGTAVAVSVDVGPLTYSASAGLLQSSNHNVPDGVQEIEFEIVPMGEDLAVA